MRGRSRGGGALRRYNYTSVLGENTIARDVWSPASWRWRLGMQNLSMLFTASSLISNGEWRQLDGSCGASGRSFDLRFLTSTKCRQEPKTVLTI
jgi:hypothetical protein